MLNTLAGIIASSGGAAAGGDYESIATTTLGSATSNITFSSIPNTYQHLQIRFMSKDASGLASITTQFNNDTASNYAYHRVYGDGSSVSASASSSVGQTYLGVQDSSQFGVTIIDILDYADTNKYKTARSLSGWDANGSGWSGLWSGLWMSTSAISTIKLFTGGGTNFTSGTTAALYGIKG